MKFISIFIYMICTFTSSAQSLTKIKQLLFSKDLAAFERYIDSSCKYFNAKAETHPRVPSNLKRQLCSSFQEMIVDVDEVVYEQGKIGASFINYYRINLVCKDSLIVYYSFQKQISNEVRDENARQEVIDSFRNERLIDSLHVSFLQTYGAKLNWEDLFVDTNIYGNGCGFVGVKPKMREELDVIVAQENYLLLTNWLQSANAEKQIYAIDGLYQLKSRGYKLTAEQQNLIAIIRNKKGKIKACGGCIYYESYINPIVNAIIAGQK